MGEGIDETEILELVEYRYMHDPNNPYGDSSDDDIAPGGDVSGMSETLGER